MPQIQVFISYAHTPADTILASYVAERLRAVDIKVWMDQSSLTAGSLLQQDIEKGIAESDHGIFIVSGSWLPRDRDWTAFELEQFAKRDAQKVRRIPIFRSPRNQLAIPPQLIRVIGFEWFDNDPDPDARFWQLHCAIMGTAPGPAESWAAQARALTGARATPAPPRPPDPRPAGARPSLRCNRAMQWSAVDDHALEPAHELLLLPGTVGQDHEHFVQRIQKYLRMDPPRSMVFVDWPTRPRSRDEFFEAISRAIDVAPDALTPTIGDRLSRANVVLLHPCIRARFVDDALKNYYTVWLPQLLQECRPQMHIKCVQPIEWPLERRRIAQWLTWFHLGGRDDDDNGKDDAERLIETVRNSVAPPFRVFRIHDLCDITDADLTEFCDLMGLTASQRDWLLTRIRSRNATTPKEIFEAIDAYLPDARSVA